MTARLRGEAGLTLIEVAVTVLVLSSGVLATVGSFSRFSATAHEAQRRAVLVSVAQSELERLRPIAYERLALASLPPASAATTAPLHPPASSEPVITGGVVRPGPDAFSVQGMSGVVLRYVTWRGQACPAVSAKVHADVGAVLGQPQLDVAAALGDLCPDGQSTKRVTVVVAPTTGAKGSNRFEPLRLSTIVSDPDHAVPAAVSYAGLKLQQAVGAVAPAPTPAPGTAAVSQDFTLTDTPCDQAGPGAATDHETRDTSSDGATCAASAQPRPDLMVLGTRAGSATLHDFSTDLTRPAAGGLALLRDDRGGPCTSAVVHGAAEPARRRSMHTWATPPASAAFETPFSGGRAAVTLWTSTALGREGAGRICLVLRRAANGEVLGATDYSLAGWPARPTQLTVGFDLARASMSAGERLLLTVRTPVDSGSDLRLLYDYAEHISQLSITTLEGREFR